MIDEKSDYIQQGDVLMFRLKSLPKGLKELKPKGNRHVLAEGETTGHAHAIHDLDNCDVYVADDGSLFMAVKAPVNLVHEEHKTQTIEPGNYHVRKVREVDPFSDAIRSVQD